MDKHDVLPIGEIVERSGFAASALRFYESEGLIEATRSAADSDASSRSVAAPARVHPGRVQRRAERWRRSRTSCHACPPTARPPRPTGTGSPGHWRGRLDEQIAALERLRTGLESCIGCGCLSLQRCAFSNAGDWVGERQGPGAGLLPDTLRKPAPDAPLSPRDGSRWTL